MKKLRPSSHCLSMFTQLDYVQILVFSRFSRLRSSTVVHQITLQLKYFVKNCRNVEYARLFKSLRMKLNEQAKFIREMQSTVDVDLFQPVNLSVINNESTSYE